MKIKTIEKVNKGIKKDSSKELRSATKNSPTNNTIIKVREVNQASPSLEEIKDLINVWLLSKSKYLAGKSEINISKIVSNGLIDRTIEERKNDIKKLILKYSR